MVSDVYKSTTFDLFVVGTLTCLLEGITSSTAEIQDTACITEAAIFDKSARIV